MSEPEKQRIEGEKTAENQEQSQREEDEAAENARVEKIVDAIEGVIQGIDRQSDENNPDKKWEHKWRKAEVLGLWFAAAIGLTAVIVSSIDSANTRKEMQGEQRAWVGPQSGVLDAPLALEKANSISITVQNTGKEPARDMVPFIQVGIWKKASETEKAFTAEINGFSDKCRKTVPTTGAQILFPTNGFGGGFTFATPIKPNLIDADLIAGRNILIAIGCVSYTTENKPHHTSFCYSYTNGTSKGTNVNLCYVGNQSD
jgi:hypothetical protein